MERTHLLRSYSKPRHSAGKAFDIILLVAIMASVLVVAIESVEVVSEKYGTLLKSPGMGFYHIVHDRIHLSDHFATKSPILYIQFFRHRGFPLHNPHLPEHFYCRLAGIARHKDPSATSSLQSTQIGALPGRSPNTFPGTQKQPPKIIVFIMAVLTTTIIMGTVMYIIEGTENGFTSIPKSIYWCIVTLTTVGYGDIAPQTTLGQTIASVIMILGYGIIAVPTGIVTSELAKHKGSNQDEYAGMSVMWPGRS